MKVITKFIVIYIFFFTEINLYTYLYCQNISVSWTFCQMHTANHWPSSVLCVCSFQLTHLPIKIYHNEKNSCQSSVKMYVLFLQKRMQQIHVLVISYFGTNAFSRIKSFENFHKEYGYFVLSDHAIMTLWRVANVFI